MKKPKLVIIIEKILIWIESFFLIAITVLVFSQVVARKMNISMIGTEELARFAYVLFSFIGWPIAAIEGTDVTVTFLFDKIKPSVRNKLLGVFHIAMSVFACVCVYSAYLNMTKAGTVTGSSNRWLKLSWIYGIVFVAILLTVVFNLIKAYLLLSGAETYVSQDEKDMAALEESLAAAKATAQNTDSHKRGETHD